MGSSKEIHKNRVESESYNRLTLRDISPKSDDIFCPRILSKHSLPAKALKKFKYSFMTIFFDYILFYYNHVSHCLDVYGNVLIVFDYFSPVI